MERRSPSDTLKHALSEVRGRPGTTAGVTLVAALVAVVLWAYSAPAAFEGTETGYELVGATRGEAVVFGIPLPTRDVQVEHVVPIIEENTAGADVKVLVCRLSGREIERSSATVDELCEDVEGVDGQELPAGGGERRGSQLVVEVTPRRSGRLHVAGFEIGTRDGMRRGSERAGVELLVETPPQ